MESPPVSSFGIRHLIEFFTMATQKDRKFPPAPAHMFGQHCEARQPGTPLKVTKDTSAWEIYNYQAEIVDKERIKDWNDSLNTLIIFVRVIFAGAPAADSYVGGGIVLGSAHCIHYRKYEAHSRRFIRYYTRYSPCHHPAARQPFHTRIQCHLLHRSALGSSSQQLFLLQYLSQSHCRSSRCSCPSMGRQVRPRSESVFGKGSSAAEAPTGYGDPEVENGPNYRVSTRAHLHFITRLLRRSRRLVMAHPPYSRINRHSRPRRWIILLLGHHDHQYGRRWSSIPDSAFEISSSLPWAPRPVFQSITSERDTIWYSRISTTHMAEVGHISQETSTAPA
jgi:hypothetical protein